MESAFKERSSFGIIKEFIQKRSGIQEPPTPYSKKITEDGFYTFYSDEVSEYFHSQGGALSETVFQYIDLLHLPSRISTSSKMRILEVGFGCGWGVISLISLAEILEPLEAIEIVSLEKDRRLVISALSQPFFKPYTHHLECEGSEVFEVSSPYFHLKVRLGEATETVKALEKEEAQFDYFIQDPFSPSKNPSLWSEDWFISLRRIGSPRAILSTYCAATRARKSMKAAGWFVCRAPGFGRKRESTLASLSSLESF